MITNEEFIQRQFKKMIKNKKSTDKVTDKLMKQFNENRNLLSKKINDRIIQYQIINNISRTATYNELEEKCQISETAFKRVISGKLKVSRNFLYKFALGIKMSVEEANEFFILCDGILDEFSDAGDYIFLHALLDNDSIYSMILEFEEYLGEKIGLRER